VVMGVPSGDLVADKWRNDLLPAIRASRYREFIPTSGSGSRGGEVTGIEFKNGATLRFMTAGGDDQSRAAFTTPNVIVTETDGFDEIGAKSREGDKFSQLERRLLAFPEGMRRLIAECTVSNETGRTWQEIHHGSCSRIALKCPHCSAWVTPEREHVTGWQAADDEETAAAATRLACPLCGVLWSNEQRIAANAAAVLVHKGQEINTAGEVTGPRLSTKTLGFRWTVINSVLNPDRLASVGGLEWKAKRAVDEDAAERDLCQSQYARPGVSAKTNLSAVEYMAIMRRVRSGLGRGVCPPGTQLVTVGVDVGKYLLHWVSVAWLNPTTPHVVEYGVQEVPSDSMAEPKAIEIALLGLREELSAGWAVGSQTVRASLHFVDSRYQTDVVRKFCAASGEAYWPTMGFGATQKRIGDFKRETGAKVLGVGEDYSVIQEVDGWQYIEVNADRWKSRLHETLRTPAGQDGGLTLPDSGNHMSYAKHMCAERQVEEFVPNRGMVTRWEQASRQNHYLDATVLAFVAAHLAGLRMPAVEQEQKREEREPGSFLTSHKGRW